VRSSTQRRNSATRQRLESPAPEESSIGGRLFERTVLCSGLEPELRQAIVRACAAEGGGELSEDEAAPNLWVQGLSLWQDLGANLRRALERGRLALGRMHAGGCMVYVASSMSPDPSLVGEIEHGAIRAGLERVVSVLAGEAAGKGVRVNALLCLVDRHELQTERLGEIAATVVFLASDEAKNISGETLALEGASDRR
jgi:hypothetical protein